MRKSGLSEGDPAGFRIRPAEQAELPIARILFPRWYDNVAAPTAFLLALSKADGILGAAAFFPFHHEPSRRSFRFDIEVAPPFRRQGVGSALLAAVARRVGSCGGQILLTWPEMECEDRFLLSNGFQPGCANLLFEADLSVISLHLSRIIGRISDRIGIPPEARLLRYDDIDRDTIISFLTTHVGVYPPGHYALLSGRKSTSYDCSRVLCIGNEVAAIMVVKVSGGTADVELRAVRQEYRKSWVNAYLMHRVSQIVGEKDVTRIRFFCDEANKDTISLARKAQAHLVRKCVRYRREL